MRAARYWMTMALLPMAAACGGEAGEDAGLAEDGAVVVATEPAATTTTPPATDGTLVPSGAEHMALGGNKISLQQVGGSGVTGEATLSAQGDGTMVMVTLMNAPQGPHVGHIHQGTCQNPGQPVAPLQDVAVPQANGTGSSHSTVSVPISQLMNGQHLVQYHQQAGDNPGTPIVCGSIPTEQVNIPGGTGVAAGTDSAAKM